MKDDGFSLTELLIVIAIIITLLGLASISGRSWLQRYQVDGQTRQMYVDLMNARVRAMSRNRVEFVTLAATQYAIFEDRNPANDNFEGSGQFDAGVDRQVMSVNTAYPITSGTTTLIQFDQRGLVTSGTCTISTAISYGSEYDCIVIAATRIKMGVMSGGNCVIR